MSWQNQIGNCPKCGAYIEARDFINETHICRVVRQK